MPVDETRYMTVAWEMYLRQDWLAPLTLNAEPYHHKPPFLFWMINFFWAIFGVSRWAGALVPLIATLTVAFLTQALARKLFPDMAKNKEFSAIPLLIIGSVPFLIYGTLIMFDVTLTVFVLLALLTMLNYAEKRRPAYILLMALALGFGVLTKGPVTWLYVLFPVLLMPFWSTNNGGRGSWYGGCAAAYILSLVPVLCWLIPMLSQSSDDFAFTLLWEQTAGRIAGAQGDTNTHDRPFWFYLPLMPVLFLPWLLFPSFWGGLKTIQKRIETDQGIRFLISLLVPTFIVFSLIGGKQPHYMVPLVPGALILTFAISRMQTRHIIRTTSVMVLLFVGGQIIASNSFLHRYDLQEIANHVKENEHHDWAYIQNYHGELNFLGRLETPLEEHDFLSIDAWFAEHPDGMVVIRYRRPEEVAKYHAIFTMPYRGKDMGIFALSKPQ